MESGCIFIKPSALSPCFPCWNLSCILQDAEHVNTEIIQMAFIDSQLDTG